MSLLHINVSHNGGQPGEALLCIQTVFACVMNFVRAHPKHTRTNSLLQMHSALRWFILLGNIAIYNQAGRCCFLISIRYYITMPWPCSLCSSTTDAHYRWFRTEELDGQGNLMPAAYVCGTCVRFLWRDHTKLETHFCFHTRNKDFPQFVCREVFKKSNKQLGFYRIHIAELERIRSRHVHVLSHFLERKAIF